MGKIKHVVANIIMKYTAAKSLYKYLFIKLSRQEVFLKKKQLLNEELYFFFCFFD